MNTIAETLTTKIIDTYDVIVLGGGVAGISASLASARQNKRTLLIEQNYILGGLATSGLVTIYLPLCDGLGNQVSFGIAEELLKLSVADWHNEKRGYPDWLGDGKNKPKTEADKRYEVDFNPQLFALSAEKLLIENGVEILYGTSLVSCTRNGDRIDAIIVENKSGRQALRATCFADATGDCYLAHYSNTPTVTFTQGNKLAAWYNHVKDGEYSLRMYGAADIPDEEKSEAQKAESIKDFRFLGLDAKEITDITLLSHSKMFEKMKEGLKEGIVPATMPTIPQVRMTRRIDGKYTITRADDHKYNENSIGVISDWRKRGRVYELPFEMLVNYKTKNLICAGRCVSNDEYMWDILRVIPCCAVTGEAAGTACALFDDFSKVDIGRLQAVLEQNGVVLHYNKGENNNVNN